MVDRQSKHIPPAIHGLPSEINPFWLVLPDQEVVYRTYTAPFTLSTVLPLVFQPFKINKPPGVHFPRISCSGVNPATHEFTAYLRILTSTDKHFIYETFSALREFVPVKCIYRLLLFIYYFVFMITESYEIEFAWSCADVQKMFWQRLMITAKLYELGLLQKKKKHCKDTVLLDLKNERTPLFLPLLFSAINFELLQMQYEFEDFKRLSQ